MKAVFIGKNGSCGFVRGEEYDIKTRVDHGQIVVTVKKDKNKVAMYKRIETFIQDWKIVYDVDFRKAEWKCGLID